jgi:hypothetical protein
VGSCRSGEMKAGGFMCGWGGMRRQCLPTDRRDRRSAAAARLVGSFPPKTRRRRVRRCENSMGFERIVVVVVVV